MTFAKMPENQHHVSLIKLLLMEARITVGCADTYSVFCRVNYHHTCHCPWPVHLTIHCSALNDR